MRHCYLGFAALCLAAPAAAQDGSEIGKARTKESAQEFLVRIAEANPAMIRVETTESRKTGWAPGSVLRIEGVPAELCQTRLFARMVAYSKYRVAEQNHLSWFFGLFGDYRVEGEFASGSAILDWSKVSQINSDETSTGITTPWGELRLILPSKELAERTAAAMEFLRVECDPTKDLAF